MKKHYVTGSEYGDVYKELKRMARSKKTQVISLVEAIEDVASNVFLDMTPLEIFKKLEIVDRVKLSKDYKTITILERK